MKSKRLWLIVSSLLALVTIGGCSMFQNNSENDKYKKEQNRMVKYLADNYKGVKKIKFKNFEENKTTGYYTSVATIDDKFEVMFYEKGLGGDISLDYYTRDFISQYPKIKDKEPSNNNIKVEYYEE